MDPREAQLREVVRRGLPARIRLHSLELTHGTLVAGQEPAPKVIIHAVEVPGPEPDPDWMIDLTFDIWGFLGGPAYITMEEPPPRM